MDDERLKDQDGDDWGNRTLCSDGNCIGVIGPDGRCKVCGLPSGGPDMQPRTETRDSDMDGDDDTGDADSPSPPAPETLGDVPVAGDDDWDSRVLCSDGNCIGVIGADGRCRACGKPHEGAPE